MFIFGEFGFDGDGGFVCRDAPVFGEVFGDLAFFAGGKVAEGAAEEELAIKLEAKQTGVYWSIVIAESAAGFVAILLFRRGKWKQMKGNVRKRWAKLTDDDLELIAGNRDEFAGRLLVPRPAAQKHGRTSCMKRKKDNRRQLSNNGSPLCPEADYGSVGSIVTRRVYNASNRVGATCGAG